MSYTNSPLKYKTTFKTKTTSPFCHEWLRVSHWEVVISSSLEELATSSTIILISRGFWRRRGRGSKASHVSLFAGNATNSCVHLTHLICEKFVTSIHPLKLCHDSIKSHTSYRGRRSRGARSWRKRRNSRSYRIIRLHSWLLWLKLVVPMMVKIGEKGIGMEKC